MSENTHSLKLQLEAFEHGKWSGDLDHCFYFYDWFCKDTSLERKAKSLMSKVKKFIKITNVDTEKTYVFFKNNCPLYGRLYDDFRICDLETGDVIWTVVPKSGHVHGKSEIWGQLNDFEEAIIEFNSWSELCKAITTLNTNQNDTLTRYNR